MQILIISLLVFGASILAIPAPIRALSTISLVPTASIVPTTLVVPETVPVVSSVKGLVPTITSSVVPEMASIVSSVTEQVPTTSSTPSSTTALVVPIPSATGMVPLPPVITTGDGAKLIQVEGPNSGAPPSLLMSTEYDIKDAIVFGSEK